MTKRAHLCLIVMLAGQITGLTPAPEGLSVRQYPPSLTVMRGEKATLCCHFRVSSLKYGVQWFKMKPGKQLVPKSSRQIFVEENQSSSLVITQVAPEDSGWYYCEVNVLQKDPERGNGTELIVLAPPSAPELFLQIPPNPQCDHWALICLTRGFHPSRVTLTWTYHSAEADIDHLSDASCTLPANNSHGSLPEPPADGALLSSDRFVKSAAAHQSQCLLMTDNRSLDVYLFSGIILPKKQSMEAGITFTCWVKDHPAMNNSLTSSFTWEASPNDFITSLNVLKLCFLSAVTLVFFLEGNVKCNRRGNKNWTVGVQSGSSQQTNL